jgi:hypothetical protein
LAAIGMGLLMLVVWACCVVAGRADECIERFGPGGGDGWSELCAGVGAAGGLGGVAGAAPGAEDGSGSAAE